MNNNNQFNYHNEDITPVLENRDFDVFAHGCNCFNAMGKGIARIVSALLPELVEADNATEKGDMAKLGTISVAILPQRKLAINAYTQYDVFKFDEETITLDYDAVRQCFRRIDKLMDALDHKNLTIPKIGTGIGLGDWEIIKNIINDELHNKNIEIYYI